MCWPAHSRLPTTKRTIFGRGERACQVCFLQVDKLYLIFFFFSNPGETVVTGCIDIKTRYFFMQDSSCPHLVTQTQAVRRNFDVLPSANVSLYCLLLKISVSRQSQLFFLVGAQFFFLSFFTRRFSVSTRSSLRCLPAFRCSVRYARRDDFAWKEV